MPQISIPLPLPFCSNCPCCCCCSVTQLCLTLCDPMDCSTPGFPVLHYLLGFAQNHVGDGQGGLAWCSSWSRKGLETERLNWTERKYMSSEGGLGDKGFEWKAKGLKFIFQASAFQEFWSSETLSFFPLKIILAEVQYIKWIQYIKYIRFAWFESPWWRWWRSEEL